MNDISLNFLSAAYYLILCY